MNELDIRNKIVNTAAGYVGATQGSSKHIDIVNTYNAIKPLPRGYKLKTSDAWCAATVSAMAAKCNLLDIIPAECSCVSMVTLAQKLGIWQENDAYVPKAGDIILYDWQDNGNGNNVGTPDHVGIVAGVSGSTITVIEGNKGSPAQVGYRYIAVNGRYIRGYILPNYASKAGKTAVVKPTATVKTEAKVTKAATATNIVNMPELSRGSIGTYVKALQYFLNGLGYNCGYVDGDFGANTAKAVIAFQRAKRLSADGIVGVDTWTALRNALPELSRKASGNCVRGVQTLLTAYGYNCGGIDGVFGDNTYGAVVRFQGAKNLIPDGIVGEQTYKMLWRR